MTESEMDRSSRNMGEYVAQMVFFLELWLNNYENTYDGLNFHDILLTEGVVEIARGLRMLLNGPTGSMMIPAHYDTQLREILARCGEEE